MADLVIPGRATYEFCAIPLDRGSRSTSVTSPVEFDQGYRSYLDTVSADVTYTFEATLLVTTTSSGTAYAGLWDVTAGGLVLGSTVFVAGTATVGPYTPVRSGPLALTAGHIYSIALWVDVDTNVANFSGARVVGST